nr:uncharacterized protein LOC109619535 [Crassostrea gigas]
MFNLLCFMYMYISIRMIFQDELNNSTHDDDGRDHDGELERRTNQQQGTELSVGAYVEILHGQETLKAVIVRPSTHPVGYWVCFFKKPTTKKPLLKLEEKEFFVFPNDLTTEIKEPRLEAFGSRIYYNFSD